MEINKSTPAKSSDSEDSEPSSFTKKKRPDKKSKKQENPSFSGRDILQDYISMKPGSLAKYQQLCYTLDTFESWSGESRITFLEQFMDNYDLFDVNCSDLVYKLSRISWHTIPSSILPNFVKFLSTLAINDVHNMSQIFYSFVNHLSPVLKENSSELMLDEQTQEAHYAMAHLFIRTIVSCNPLSIRVLLKSCVKQFPHIKLPAPKLLGYIRNLIHLSEWTDDEEFASEIWSLIIERLLQVDASSIELQDEEQRLSFCNPISESYLLEGSSLINLKDDQEEKEEEELENPMTTKLDLLIALVLTYLGSEDDLHEKYNIGDSNHLSMLPNDLNFKSMSHAKNKKHQNSIFKMLLEGFDEHVLATVGVHSTPFIWFYVCSLSEEYCSLMLEFLWEVAKSPTDSPNEWRKAHNAAAFLCGFLARAKYVDFKLSCHWMREISCWCREYVSKYSTVKQSQSYGIQHGTFYAIVQSLLFIFCYRHGEMQREKAFDEVRSWELDKVVHCPLEPLRWISQGVALCFLSVNRQLKLVQYNQCMLDSTRHSVNRRKKPNSSLELFFPFSFCSLKICSSFIVPLMHRFSPLVPEDSAEPETLSEDEEMEGEEDSIPVDEGYEEELMFGYGQKAKQIESEQQLETNQEMMEEA